MKKRNKQGHQMATTAARGYVLEIFSGRGSGTSDRGC